MSRRATTALEAPFPIVTHGESSTVPVKVYEIRPVERSVGSDNRRNDISVRLQYLENDSLYATVKPIQVTPPFPRNSRTNVRLKAGPEEVLNDVRGREHEFTLDENGFCYINAPTKFKDWSSQPAIAKEFLPEMEELLKREVDGCDEIIFYDARIRQESDQGVRVQGLSYNPFARQVHVDNTEPSIIEKVRSITEMKAEYHLNGRVRVINIWRPIKHPVYDCGLAIADGAKLKEGDVIECDRHRQDTGEYWDTMGVIRYRPGFDWYYMSLQDEPDVLLFKNYDSATNVRARLCLHTAFDFPPKDVPANAPTRESIEVRALIFTRPNGVRKPSWTPTPHPLAITLEQSNLKLVDEEHSITDRLRTDIDEGKEVKDAVLLLRRQEIHRLESVREALVSERDGLQWELKQSRSELEQARQQISIQAAHVEALQSTISALERELNCTNGDLHSQVQNLSRALVDSRMYDSTRVRNEDDSRLYANHTTGARDAQSSESAVLLEHIKQQQREVQAWKGQAMMRAHEAVSRSWQGSVDEAVRREREKDYSVIKSLRDEIKRLKAV